MGIHHKKHRRLDRLILVLLMLVTGAVTEATPKRVLLLNPYGRDAAPFSAAIASFRTTLTRDLGERVDLFEVPLDLSRFGEAQGEAALVTFLKGRIQSHPVDLVVSVGSDGARFAVRHREELFADLPLLFIGVDPRFVSTDPLNANTTLATQRVNLSGMIEDILQMKPETRNIAVVFGSSDLEQKWTRACRQEFERFADRVEFTWLTDLTLEQLLDRSAHLPPDSFILHALFVVDAAGVPSDKNEALKRLNQVANAPVFAYFRSEFGLGSVGGHLYEDTVVGAEGGRMAIRILRGESPGEISPVILDQVVPVYDWRELNRWNINEAVLPADSIIEYRQPGFWRQYGWPFAGAIGFFLLQTGLIAGLLINRSRRLRGEAEAALIAEISSRFVNLSIDEVDREIEDAQRRLCQFFNLDFSTLWQWSSEPPYFLKLTHFHTARDGPQPSDRMNQDDYPWAGPKLLAGQIITVESADDLPAEAARDADTLRRFGIKSNIAFPLSMGSETPFGVLGLGTMQKERSWPKVMVNRLHQVAQIFAGTLARRRADEALQASEAHLVTGAELAGLGYYEVDLASSSCFADERFGAICGIPPGLQPGLGALEFWINHLHPDDRARVMDERRELHEGRIERLSVEYRFLHPTGKVKWLHHLARATTRDPSGHAIRTFGVVRDISLEKQAELDIEELRGNLTHLSRVNSLGTLSGSLAHELNQPLGIILSNAQAAEELLLQEPLDLEELKDILSDIVAADRRASEVILRLRALLKRGQLTLLPLDLNFVIEEVLQLTRADLIGRGVAVAFEKGLDLPLVAGDRVQIQQILLNLILNAAEAMATKPQGTRRIHLRTVLGNDCVSTSVRDEGAGLPGDLERLFQPFFTTKDLGLGMGLAICRSIIDSHHGRIWAETGTEGGALFHFDLPLAKVTAEL